MPFNVTLSIPKINCGHCVATIKRETKDLPGVLSVDADPDKKTATYILINESVLPSVKEKLAKIHFPVGE